MVLVFPRRVFCPSSEVLLAPVLLLPFELSKPTTTSSCAASSDRSEGVLLLAPVLRLLFELCSRRTSTSSCAASSVRAVVEAYFY